MGECCQSGLQSFFFFLQRREAQEDNALPGVLSLVVGHGSRKAIGYLD